MSLGTSNRDGGKTSESGHLRAAAKMANAAVIDGLNVSQRAAGANMSVDIAVGDAFLKRSDGSYAHPVFNDAVLNQAITTADGSNPRRDILVIYLDYGVTPSTAVSNNTNNVVKVMVVAGTPAGSPTDPSSATIQSAVGAGNPWTKLARIRVPASQTSITNSLIDDLRLMATGLIQGGWNYDDVNTWAYGSASTFTVAGSDVTALFPVGTKLALYQSGSIKYFTVVSSVFSTNTTVTVDGQGTYTLANVPIDRPAYSYALHPSGFPDKESNVQFYNPYKAKAHAASNQNISDITATKITLDAEDYDTNNNFASSAYTAPVAGFYQINAGIRISTAKGASYGMDIRKNGAIIASRSIIPYPAANTFGDVSEEYSDLIQLAAGDVITMYSTVDTSDGSVAVASGHATISYTYMGLYLQSRV